MINILIPAAGGSDFFEANYYPKPLVEVKGMPMIERTIRNYDCIQEKHFVFILSEEECLRFHLDSIVKLLTDGNADVIRLKHKTGGALCSALMAIDMINNEDPLIISNYDQIADVDYARVLKCFAKNQADGGLISFPSVHPRWSYIRSEDGFIVEVAEKHPISKSAIMGFYYYQKGKDFVEAAETAIRKDNQVDGKFYVSSSMNELILLGKKIVEYPIAADQFHAFFSMEKINEYERGIHEKSKH